MALKVSTTEQFIEKGIRVHGNKYDYSLVDYINGLTKVKIICKKHGLFEQLPKNHGKGYGCMECGIDKVSKYMSKTQEHFINRAKNVHGDKYDYSLSEYNGSSKKVKIICRKHTIFEQSPNNHFKGAGCPECKRENISKLFIDDKNSFIEKSIKAHGYRYGYKLVEYKNSKTKVKIKCYKHGEFEQFPPVHCSGSGCPKCGKESTTYYQKTNPSCWGSTGWEKKSKNSKYFDSFKVYVIKCYNEDEVFYKIGRTFTTVKRRFGCKKNMPYHYDILKEFIFNDARECFNKESELKRFNKDNRYKPMVKFGGRHECFSSNPKI